MGPLSSQLPISEYQENAAGHDLSRESLGAVRLWRGRQLPAALAALAGLLSPLSSEVTMGADNTQPRVVSAGDPLTARRWSGQISPENDPRKDDGKTVVPLRSAGTFGIYSYSPVLGKNETARTSTVWTTSDPHTFAVEPLFALEQRAAALKFRMPDGSVRLLPSVINDVEQVSGERGELYFLTFSGVLYPQGKNGALSERYIDQSRKAIRDPSATIVPCPVEGLQVEVFDTSTGHHYDTFSVEGLSTPFTVKMRVGVPAADMAQFVSHAERGMITFAWSPISTGYQHNVAWAVKEFCQDGMASAESKFVAAHNGHTGLYTDAERNELEMYLRGTVREIISAGNDPELAATLFDRLQSIVMPSLWTPNEIVSLSSLSSQQQERAREHLAPLLSTSQEAQEDWQRNVKGDEHSKTTTWKVGGGGGLNLGFVKVGGGGGRNVSNTDLRKLEEGTGLTIKRIDATTHYVEMGARVAQVDRTRLSQLFAHGTFFVNVKPLPGFMRRAEVPISFTTDQAERSLGEELSVSRLLEQHDRDLKRIGELEGENRELAATVTKLNRDYSTAQANEKKASKALTASTKDENSAEASRDALINVLVRYCRPKVHQGFNGLAVDYSRLYEVARFIRDENLRTALVDRFLSVYSRDSEFKNVALPKPQLPKAR